MKQRLSDAIDGYERFRLSVVRAANTRKNDRQTLLPLLSHCGNVYVNEIRQERMTEFLYERTKTRSANTLRNDYTVLRCFFKWAEDHGVCPRSRNPMIGRDLPKKEVRERSRMSVSDFPHLLDVAGKRHPRDRAFVAVALFTLARCSEIVSLTVDDLRLNDGRIRAKIHKTKDFDEIPISEELDREMRRWLTYYSQECGPLEKSWHLIPARKLIRFPGFDAGQGITKLNPPRPLTNATSQIVKPALQGAGFEVEGNPRLLGEGSHTLRRSAARALYDSLADAGHDNAVRVVMTMLHHTEMKTTELYIGVSGDKRQRDDIIAGKPMFGLPGQIEIGAVEDGQGEDHRASL